jgi:DNA-3-methyladenine glycosylase II
LALLPAADRRTKNRRILHAAAARRLANVDPILRRIITRVGPCTLRRYPRYFATLCDSIVSQQLSSRVAEVIFARFEALYPHCRPTPQRVAKTPVPRLRTAGLSRQKARYLKELAKGFASGRIRPNRLARQSNEEIIETLTSIHGIGRWTAEMFLIFSLNRLDVLPADDLGIKKAVQRLYGLRSLPTAKKIKAIGKGWQPYETIASWYLWRSLRLTS